jgi:hypothetical protein
VRAARSAHKPVNDYALIETGKDAAGTGTGPIPLRDAVLCIDCDVLYQGLSGPCPCCGGMSRLPLQTILHSMACGS